MHGADEVDLDAARARLVAEHAVLDGVAESAAGASGVVELDQTRVGRVSRMDALQQQAMSKASGKRREIALRRIESALERIEAGSYGYCLRCEEPVGAERLAADPAATLCIACARRAESG